MCILSEEKQRRRQWLQAIVEGNADDLTADHRSWTRWNIDQTEQALAEALVLYQQAECQGSWRKRLQLFLAIPRRGFLPYVSYRLLCRPGRRSLRLAAWAFGRTRSPGLPEVVIRENLHELAPDDRHNLARLVDLYFDRAEYEKALETIENEVSKADRSSFARMQGHALFLLGRWDEALAAYRNEEKIPSAGCCPPGLHEAAALVFLGETDSAADVFKQVFDESPNDVVFHYFDSLEDAVLKGIPKIEAIIFSEHNAGFCGLQYEALPVFGGGRFVGDKEQSVDRLLERWKCFRNRRRYRAIRRSANEVNCPVCESTKFEYFFKNPATGFTLVLCPECSHRYVRPMPSEKALHALYEKDYFSGKDRFALRTLEALERCEPLSSEPAYMSLFAWLDRTGWREWELERGDHRRALDVGCASGACLIAMRLRGWNVVGQDIGGQYGEYYRRLEIPYSESSLDRIPMEEESLDLIVMTHVIEHLADPGRTLQWCRSRLKPGGRLVVMTPAAGTITAWLGGALWYAVTEHVQFFTPESLRRLGERIALRPLYYRTRVGVEVETPFRNWRRWRIGGALRALIEKTGQGDVVEMVFEKISSDN